MLYNQIKLLYDQSLYSNLISLVDLMSPLSGRNLYSLTTYQKLDIHLYYAGAHFYVAEYRKALVFYNKVLQLREHLLTFNDRLDPLGSQRDLPTDVDIKFQIYLCAFKLGNIQEAVDVLESIHYDQRTLKTKMALAKVYHKLGMERIAIITYADVLRECPLALEAAEALVSLGIGNIGVTSLITSYSCNIPNLDWINKWITAHAHLCKRKYTEAIATLVPLDNVNSLEDNFYFLMTMGEFYYYNEDYQNALLYMRRARYLEPDATKGADSFAAVLYKTDNINELNRLISLLPTSETYVAWAYSLYASKKLDKAATVLTDQAAKFDIDNTEARLLEGNIYLEQKMYHIALTVFEFLIKTKPYRFEPYKGMVDCYLGMAEVENALGIAYNCYEQFDGTTRAETLYASALMTDPECVEEAKDMLKGVLIRDENYLPAVYALAEIYEQEMDRAAAVALLFKQVGTQTQSKLYEMLGHLWYKVHNKEDGWNSRAICMQLEDNYEESSWEDMD